MLKIFIKYYKPYKRMFFLDLFVAMLASMCDLVYPMATRRLVDNIIPNREYKLFIMIAVGLIIVYIIKMGCNYFLQYWGHLVGVGMQADMRRDVYTHLQKLPVKYFDNNQTGNIMSRIVNDLQEVSELAHHGPEDLFISGIMLIGSFSILVRVNLQLTLIIFVLLPFIVVFATIMRKRLNNSFLKTKEKTGDINARLQNSISGIRVSKAFIMKEEEQERFEYDNQNYVKARGIAYRYMAQFGAGMTFLIDMLNYVVIIFGGIFLYQEKITVGELMAYMLYVRTFLQPLNKLVSFVEQYQNGMSGFKRFMELMEENKETDKENAVDVGELQGAIEFRNVNFSYEDTDILKNLSFKIEKGKMLALVGPSGGGKTTICNLIPRFYNIDDGDILIDGTSVYDMTLDSLRKNIGIVQQDVFLFTGTVRDNIALGKNGATDEEIMAAARSANIHDLIMELPEGYETYIGERGVKLSGGQKQRVAIARIFLKNPSILILDEATSALDNITEKIIQDSLEELCKGRTTIVVAHRLTTIKNADEIIVITDDGIKERGNHEELLEKEGYYYKLQSGIA